MNDDEGETYSGITRCMRMTKKTEVYPLEEAGISVVNVRRPRKKVMAQSKRPGKGK